MSASAFDPVLMLRRLRGNQVRFVVIGGLAAKAHGSPTLTVDLDICPAPDRENLERLAAVLGGLGARLRGGPSDIPFVADARTLGRVEILTLTTDAGDLDVIIRPPGIADFAQLDANAVSVEVGDGVVVRVASLDDLIAMKRATGRPKDRVEIEILGALREEIERS